MSQIRHREADADEVLSLNEDFNEYYEELDEEEEESPVVEKRGRPRIEERWVRCLSLDTDNLTVPRSYQLKDDLIFE